MTQWPDDSIHFMRRAIALSLENARAGRGPFAAVIVRGDEVLAEGTNRVTDTSDPTAHAEIVAIRAACAKLKSFELTGCDLYSSCEPCPMCLGAIYWARPRQVFFANGREDAAAIGFDDALIYGEMTVPFSQRKIPMTQMMREEALAAFQEWVRNPNKKPY
jgi:tRNA(Arg) A34 adenosine deaminase TadA